MKQGRAGTVWHTDPASAGPSPVVGDVVGGHYRVDAVLAEGGMAVVYRATNTATGKACALKILHAQLGLRPEFVELFAKEARVTTLIGENEHIINVFDAGVDAERGIPFIVMELCEGETLAQALERGPLPRGLCVTLLEQLARALEQAHRAGVVHRDLKPSNLFVTSDREGRPILKVMDFGIAKVLEGEAVRTATHIGTPAYNAPEQMGSSTRRIAAKQGIVIAPSVSPATDVWAIGLIAYEMLTGEMHGQYWGVETLSELPMKVAFEEHMPATERAGAGADLLPEGFDEWFERCLRKNADERFPTAGDAIGELLCLLDGRAAAVEEVEASEEQVQNAETRLFRAGPPPMPRSVSQASPQPPSARPSSRPSARPSSRPSRPSSRPEGGRRGTAPQAPVGVAGGTADAEPARAHLEQPQTPSARPIVRATGATPASPRAASRSPRTAYLFGALVLVAGAATVVAFRMSDTAPTTTPAAVATSSAPSAKADANCAAAPADAAAVAACERACQGGSLAACAHAAGAYDRGTGVQKDAARARTAYEQACAVGPLGAAADAPHWSANVASTTCTGGCVPEACAALAGFYADGRGGAPQSERAATALLKRVCSVDGGDASRGVVGCVALGERREKAAELEAARRYYEAACDGGREAGCVALGRTLQKSGEPKDEKRARGLFDKACQAGDLVGCTLFGKMVEHGRGGWVADEPAAIALYERACDGQELFGCVHLARSYALGKGKLPKDTVRAAELLQKTCDGGEQLGCASLAGMIVAGQGGLARDEKRAFALATLACDKGALLGCVGLGQLYRNGLAGLQKDASEARSLFERACRGGEPEGCAAQGRLDLSALLESTPEGGEAPAVPAELATLFERACDGGAADGCAALAELREGGAKGSDAELGEAGKLYQQACEGGAMRACTNLANLVYQGVGGLEHDAKRSAELNERACKGGDVVGCVRLGTLYALGEGVAKNPKRAAELQREACREPFEGEAQRGRCERLAKLLADKAGEDKAPEKAPEKPGDKLAPKPPEK